MKLVLSRINKKTLISSVLALGTIMSASCTAENNTKTATTKTPATKAEKATTQEKKATVTAADKKKMSVALGQKVGVQI